MKVDISRGTILHRMFETTIPPKHKFFVVVGESKTEVRGFFFINSRVNKFVERDDARFAMQMPIKHDVYDFLAHDSIVAGHELHTIEKAVLEQELSSHKTTIKGHLTEEDLNRLLEAARASELFSGYEKDTFFN